MSEQAKRGEELFDRLNKNKKKRKRKVIRTVLILILILAVVLFSGVLYLRRQVRERFATDAAEVERYEVVTGTINTVVSGSGTLTEVGLEQLSLPEGVEITEVFVKAGDTAEAGEVLASVDLATVMTALSDTQAQIKSLDDKIAAAKGDTVSSNVSTGISGRVKRLFAQVGDDVASVVAENGALAVLSLDGYMAVDLETALLERDQTVTVVRSDGTELEGTVSSAAGGKATVLVTDKGPVYDEEVTVRTEAGETAGSGRLYIHSPLAITGYAGTISHVSVSENTYVYAYSPLFKLTDTEFTANYDSLLRDRSELEEQLLQLLTVYRDGAVLAGTDCMISSVEYDPDEEADASGAFTYTAEDGGTNLLSFFPNEHMEITISVDETDILALKLDQEAEVQVSSVSEDAFTGYVTEINKVADTSSGVTYYSAVVTLDKTDEMLPGMSAEVDVKIEGTENALLIPVDALHQTRDSYYVFTSYDEETQQYGGRVEVTIGMQNDNYVEILSGLNVGDTVCYTESQDFFFGFGGMSGGMPGGIGGGNNRPGGNDRGGSRDRRPESRGG